MPQLSEQFGAVADAGHKVAQTGGLTTLASWLVSSQGGVLIGIVIGIAGLAIQFYYRRKQDKREEEEHQLKMTMRQDGFEARAELREDSRG